MDTDNFLLARLQQGCAGREAEVFIDGPDGRSFARFFENAGRMAAALQALGVRPGDRVAAQVGKSAEALELYVGTVMAGGVFLPLNPAYTPAEVGYFLGDAAPQVFVTAPEHVDELAEVARAVPEVVTLGTDGNGSLPDLAAGQGAVPPVPRAANDLAAILYTSGTTGRSKGAMLTHRALASNSATLVDVWRFTPDDVLIHALPIFHTHGLFVATNVALMAGASLIFHPAFDADAILEDMPRATALMGVPTFYTRLLDRPELTPALTANMRLFISGSAPLLSETHARWQVRTGHTILERYGMTETNMSTSNPYDGERRPGTVGFPLPGVELKITGDNGQELPDGEIGTIEVRGDNVFAGYWQMPEKTAEELRPDGWFVTGDLGMRDKDGYITIVGRSKDLIISGGLNVYPKEVESVIDDIEGVRESAVIGVPDADFGEQVVAVVVRDDPTLDRGTVARVAGERLAKFKCPRRIEFVEALPRNTMGKVQKNALRETYS